MLRDFFVRRYWRRFWTRGGIRTWGEEPCVRRAANRRVSGSPDVWPVEWFAASVVRRPFRRALSLGCGEGSLERDLMSKGLCERILGLDLSPDVLDLARRRAREAGFDAVRYRSEDLNRFELEAASYDAVFAQQSLHHVHELERCLEQVARALEGGGIFYFDEYVGPSRHQWRRELLEEADRVYRDLPRAVRRRRRLQLPVDWRDPSEAVRSAEIVPLTEKHFEIRERRDYGGNLLSVIHPHLRLEAVDPAVREAVLEGLLEREDELLAAGVPSYYTVVVAEPRPSRSRRNGR